jgi:3-deoxy-D-manno-octulosonate 8-phosphate phosphatase (KDO 8-P phosphatase)
MADPGDAKNLTLSLARRASRVEVLVLDVDGVLTDGGIVYGTGDLETKEFHVRDGSGLKLWNLSGKRSAIITGRRSPVVDVRAWELGVELVIQGASEKSAGFREVLQKFGILPEAVCYVGDDLPDLPPLNQAGLAVAVADACPEARAAAHYLTRRPGGRGAVREVVELILRCQGTWQTKG